MIYKIYLLKDINLDQFNLILLVLANFNVSKFRVHDQDILLNKEDCIGELSSHKLRVRRNPRDEDKTCPI